MPKKSSKTSKTKDGIDYSTIDYAHLSMKDFVSLDEMHEEFLKKPGYKEAYEKERVRMAKKAARLGLVLSSSKSLKKKIMA